MSAPTGSQFELVHGDYAATVTEVGAGLRELTWRGRDLVLPFPVDACAPHFRGAVLAPWPNRVGHGRWTWEGIEHQLALSEPEHDAALHGLVAWNEWRPRTLDAASVTLTTHVVPQPGYPFHLALAMTWTLSPTGLHASLAAENIGHRPAPYGCSIHPYLVAPRGRVDDWTLRLPARTRLEVDANLLPAGDVPTAPPSEADLATGQRIGAARIDHCYADVEYDAGHAEAIVLDGAGDGVRLRFGTGTPWVQVCTSDFPEPDERRAAVAVEPMTCPPDALRSGVDLVVLEPGAHHEAWWEIAAISSEPG